jgi:hypothetical protein
MNGFPIGRPELKWAAVRNMMVRPELIQKYEGEEREENRREQTERETRRDEMRRGRRGRRGGRERSEIRRAEKRRDK